MIALTGNGQKYEVDAPPDTPLLWVLRDTFNTYFQRLRYPDAPTKLETLVAQFQAATRAIAPPDQVTEISPVLERTIGIMGIPDKNNPETKKITREIRGEEKPQVKLSDWLQSRGVQVAGLVLISGALIAALGAFLAGTALSPLAPMIAAILGFSLLWAGFFAGGNKSGILSRNALVAVTLLVGAILFISYVGMPVLSDAVNLVFTGQMPQVSMLRGTVLTAHAVTQSALPAGLFDPQNGLLGGLSVVFSLGVTSLVQGADLKRFKPKTFRDSTGVPEVTYTLENIRPKVEKQYNDNIGEEGCTHDAFDICPENIVSMGSLAMTLMGLPNYARKVTVSPRTKDYPLNPIGSGPVRTGITDTPIFILYFLSVPDPTGEVPVTMKPAIYLINPRVKTYERSEIIRPDSDRARGAFTEYLQDILRVFFHPICTLFLMMT